MVITWLPLPSYRDSADALSDRDLEQQRYDVVYLLEQLHSIEKSELPSEYLSEVGNADIELLMKMWVGKEMQLCEYGAVVCEEWLTRKAFQEDPALEIILKHLDWATDDSSNMAKPVWFGNIEFHHSHQAALVRRDADSYRGLFRVERDLPIIWPGSDG